MNLPTYPQRTGSFNKVAAVLIAALLTTAAFFIWNSSRQQPAGPVSAGPTEPPAPATKRFAPEGVLYLTKRATVTYESGIIGIPVGAEVKIVGPAKGGKIPVDYRGNHLILPANQLTNDLYLVDSLIRQQRARASLPNKKPAPSPAATSSSEGIAVRFFSSIGSLWQNLCDWIHPPPPPPVDPQKVKNRHELIRYYERAIRELELRSRCQTVHDPATDATSSSAASASSSFVSSQQTLTPSRNSEHTARLKQIAEYKNRIAKMKAEIGE